MTLPGKNKCTVGLKQTALLTLASHSNSDVGTESRTSYTQQNVMTVLMKHVLNKNILEL